MIAEIRPTLRLAVPVVVVQLGMMTMGVVDTLMVGRVSAAALASVALGNLYFYAVAVFAMGCLMALDPLVSQAVGAGDEPAVVRGLQRGLVLAAVLSVPVCLALVPAEGLLALLGQPVEIVPLAGAYARACIPGILPFLAFIALRQTLQALHRTGPILATVVVANVLNVGLNAVFIYGSLGVPAMGPVGAAWATSVCRFVLALALLAFGARELLPRLHPWRDDTWRLAPLRGMLRLGAPIGAQMQLEMGVFGVVGLLMGRLGTTEMAAHQVALNLASLTFMVPLGVSAAASVRVGHAVGRGDPAGARASAAAALACGAGFMAVCGAVFVLVPQVLARAYTPDPAVVAIAAVLLPLAGFFQVFDGLQVVAIGILRGTGDTRVPMLVNVLGFWILGLPVSLLLAFRLEGGPAGLWWGLVVGLGVVAAFLLLRVRVRLGRPVARTRLEGEAA